MAQRSRGDFCRYHSSLEPALSEFAIIVAARFWKSQYEFFAHARMAANAGVSDATYERAKTALTERGVVDLVGIVGYYGLVSMTMNVFEVSLPEGEKPRFDE